MYKYVIISVMESMQAWVFFVLVSLVIIQTVIFRNDLRIMCGEN